MKDPIQPKTPLEAYLLIQRSQERVYRCVAESLEIISSIDLSKLPPDLQKSLAERVADAPAMLHGVIKTHQRGLAKILRVLARSQHSPSRRPASRPN